MNEAKKNELYDRYENSTHLLGRLGTAAAILLLLAVPMAMGWVLNASPDWKAFGVGFAQAALIYWTSGVVEFLVYAPMLGSGASYLTFITGNAVNLKLPCAVNAREICGTQVGTPENDIVSTLSVATSSLVTTLVLIHRLRPGPRQLSHHLGAGKPGPGPRLQQRHPRFVRGAGLQVFLQEPQAGGGAAGLHVRAVRGGAQPDRKRLLPHPGQRRHGHRHCLLDVPHRAA